MQQELVLHNSLHFFRVFGSHSCAFGEKASFLKTQTYAKCQFMSWELHVNLRGKTAKRLKHLIVDIFTIFESHEPSALCQEANPAMHVLFAPSAHGQRPFSCVMDMLPFQLERLPN